MSKSEQFEAIGRLVEEYTSAKARLTALRAEGQRHAEAMVEIGIGILQNEASRYREMLQKAATIPGGEHIAKLLADTSEEADRLHSLGRQLGNCGLEIKEDFMGPLMPVDQASLRPKR